MHKQASTHARTHKLTDRHTHTYIHSHTCAHARKHSQTRTCIHTLTCSHAHRHAHGRPKRLRHTAKRDAVQHHLRTLACVLPSSLCIHRACKHSQFGLVIICFCAVIPGQSLASKGEEQGKCWLSLAWVSAVLHRGV